MSEWKEIELGEIVKIKNGFAFKSKDFVETGIPVIKIKNVKPNCILLDTLSYVSEEIARDKGQYIIKPEDILITMSGNRADGSPESWVGKVAIFNKPGSYLLNQRVSIIRVDRSRADQRFIAYYLSSWHSQLYFINNANSSGGQANISPDIVKDFEVNLPPLAEQKAIASVLSSLDDKIDLLHRQNKTLKAMAETLFRQWFVEEAKEEIYLDEFLMINPKLVIERGKKAPYLEMKNVQANGSSPTDWYYREYTSGMKFQNGDTLLARITPCLENGKTTYVQFLNENQVGWGSTEFLVLRARKPFPKFTSYLLAKNEDFRSFVIGTMTGSSGRQRVQTASLNEYKVGIPDQKTMDYLNFHFGTIEEKIKLNTDQIMTLEKLRDTLLPKLMSGEVRVNMDKSLIVN